MNKPTTQIIRGMAGDKMFQQISVRSKVSLAELGVGQMRVAGEQSSEAGLIHQSVLGRPVTVPHASPPGGTGSELTREGSSILACSLNAGTFSRRWWGTLRE